MIGIVRPEDMDNDSYFIGEAKQVSLHDIIPLLSADL